MQIIGKVGFKEEPVGFTARRVCRDGSVSLVEDAVQAESLLSVYVNGVLTMKLACSASCLSELVVGRLYTECMISSADDIDTLVISESDMRADVFLRNDACEEGAVPVSDSDVPEVGAIPTCSSKNAVLDWTLYREDELRPVEPIDWTPVQIFRICDEFALDKTSHSRTRGAHSAYLCSLDETLCVREDIGRHNAFDKVIGWALMNGVDLSRCLVYTSGRVPTDMVVKAIRARLPILVSKAVATDKTVELASRYHLTLICEGKEDSFAILNDPRSSLSAIQASA